ncbi:DUF1642 domain-containing protein [Streptococcus suis]|uniref:DUF1642 domain-containing protein n=1 Tax=Streptococcus suis TaxID=1307 RepID=UPI000698DDD7|nr:DUF1642 domain-containing protein [Streptococcus suis]NQG47268.1 DUF1642 domain-containing protein [Streptococcus suis]CYW02217.1 phage protein [Streptococcus suis]
MNKQEAIKRIEQMGEYERFVDEPISKGSVLNIISQIHEPQKVVVPKFIGDLIEELKIDEYTIGEIGACVYDDEEQKWIDDNEEQFYRAFLDGYEIEQEKLYTVEFPTGQRLYKNHPNGSDKVAIVIKFAHHAEKDGHFTKRELEETGFGWVFDCDGVKVVEVE